MSDCARQVYSRGLKRVKMNRYSAKSCDIMSALEELQTRLGNRYRPRKQRPIQNSLDSRVGLLKVVATLHRKDESRDWLA